MKLGILLFLFTLCAAAEEADMPSFALPVEPTPHGDPPVENPLGEKAVELTPELNTTIQVKSMTVAENPPPPALPPVTPPVPAPVEYGPSAEEGYGVVELKNSGAIQVVERTASPEPAQVPGPSPEEPNVANQPAEESSL